VGASPLFTQRVDRDLAEDFASMLSLNDRSDWGRPSEPHCFVALKGNDGGFFEEPFNGNSGHIPLSRI
jgi:hypothetical protein